MDESSDVEEKIFCFEVRWKSKVITLAIFEKNWNWKRVCGKEENSMTRNDKIIFVLFKKKKKYLKNKEE